MVMRDTTHFDMLRVCGIIKQPLTKNVCRATFNVQKLKQSMSGNSDSILDLIDDDKERSHQAN